METINSKWVLLPHVCTDVSINGALGSLADKLRQVSYSNAELAFEKPYMLRVTEKAGRGKSVASGSYIETGKEEVRFTLPTSITSLSLYRDCLIQLNIRLRLTLTTILIRLYLSVGLFVY